MSDNIVERLRHRIVVDGLEMPGNDGLHREAADEIERLTAEIGRARKLQVWLYNQGYHAGHHDTVEGMYTDVLPVDMETYHDDVVADLLAENPAGEERTETDGEMDAAESGQCQHHQGKLYMTEFSADDESCGIDSAPTRRCDHEWRHEWRYDIHDSQKRCINCGKDWA